MKKQKGVVQSAGEEESEIDDEKEEEARPISDKNEQIFFDFFSKLAGRDRAVSGKILIVVLWTIFSLEIKIKKIIIKLGNCKIC